VTHHKRMGRVGRAEAERDAIVHSLQAPVPPAERVGPIGVGEDTGRYWRGEEGRSGEGAGRGGGAWGHQYGEPSLRRELNLH
jgi:hypothetical protein